MGLLDFVLGLFGLGKRTAPSSLSSTDSAETAPVPAAARKIKRRPKLTPFRRARTGEKPQREIAADAVPQLPYKFARMSVFGGFLDLSRDQNTDRLQKYHLPQFRTPQELAEWLGIPLGHLAWLVHRFNDGQSPPDERSAHYHFVWIDKRAGGKRLIEIPKPMLRAAQDKILREILDRVPPHLAAHGFVVGRSIRTNALPHVRQRVMVKFDLENFYPNVTFSRVVAIFRSLGYSREVANWLARLTTSDLPPDVRERAQRFDEKCPYLSRHLPQGACTSPALANLSAFALDLRLSGLARTFRANYTRYADDLTFSGDDKFLGSLRTFIPLVSQVVRSERFRIHSKKRKVLRNNQQQRIAGVVVNGRVNISRRDYDRLKATLVNCIRRGPSTQNHDRHNDFASHLRGRIAHVSHLNSARGEKLLALYEQINWSR